MNNKNIHRFEPLWNDWYIDEVIGKGSSGIVYKISKKLYDKKHFAALKVIHVPTEEQLENIISSTGNTDSNFIDNYFKNLLKDMTSEMICYIN